MLYDPKTKSNNEELCKEACDQLQSITSNAMGLVNVFRLEGDDSSQDIEQTILNSFINCMKGSVKNLDSYENLKLSIKWNRIDVARKIFEIPELEIDSKKMQYLLELALIENRPEFVELFFENQVNVRDFLTMRRFYFLYNSNKVSSVYLFPFSKLVFNWFC